MTKLTKVLVLLTAFAATVSSAQAGEMKIDAVMSPKESIRHDFQDGSKRFVLMVRREGSAVGNGPLAGASVTEYGFHTLSPADGADPRGYLVFDKNGDKAYVKWRLRGIMLPTPQGPKPARLVEAGYWEIVGGTGALAGVKGFGELHIAAVSETDRKFTLSGETAGGK